MFSSVEHLVVRLLQPSLLLHAYRASLLLPHRCNFQTSVRMRFTEARTRSIFTTPLPDNHMNLYILDVSYRVNGRAGTLYPVVLQQGSETVLVDCGYAGFLPLLQQAMEKHGLSLSDLTGVVITHHDIDHMGALAELKARYPTIRVYASAIEKPYIDGSRKSLRLQQAEDLYACLPEDQKAGALEFQQHLKSVQPAAVDEAIPLDTDLPFMAGVRVVATPGHTPGHISLYLPELKTLVAADALACQDGVLDLANPQFTLDMPQALASIGKMQQLELDRVVCYHGGEVKGDIAAQLRALVGRYTNA